MREAAYFYLSSLNVPNAAHEHFPQQNQGEQNTIDSPSQFFFKLDLQVQTGLRDQFCEQFGEHWDSDSWNKYFVEPLHELRNMYFPTNTQNVDCGFCDELLAVLNYVHDNLDDQYLIFLVLYAAYQVNTGKKSASDVFSEVHSITNSKKDNTVAEHVQHLQKQKIQTTFQS